MIVLLCRTYLELLRQEVPLLKRDFASMHQSVRSCRFLATQRFSAAQADILRAIDLATIFYFKEVKCLQRSVVTARLLRRYGFAAEMVIGVQPMPFCAHAWVELEGTVLNDKPYVALMYAVIERC